jgi:hypothetical protein
VEDKKSNIAKAPVSRGRGEAHLQIIKITLKITDFHLWSYQCRSTERGKIRKKSHKRRKTFANTPPSACLCSTGHLRLLTRTPGPSP